MTENLSAILHMIAIWTGLALVAAICLDIIRRIWNWSRWYVPTRCAKDKTHLPDSIQHDEIFRQLSAADTLAEAVITFKRYQHTTQARNRLWTACSDYRKTRGFLGRE